MRIKKRLQKLHKAMMKLKIRLYRDVLSTCAVVGNPRIALPTLFLGQGTITCADNVQLGYFPSPFFFSHYNHIEARNKEASIVVGEGTVINNAMVLISNGAGIEIGPRCLIGPCVEMYDTDFHVMDPALRHVQDPPSRKVTIGENVFIGAGVKILKGVTIGRNSVIGAGSVVTQSFPDNVVIAGNPARKVRDL